MEIGTASGPGGRGRTGRGFRAVSFRRDGASSATGRGARGGRKERRGAAFGPSAGRRGPFLGERGGAALSSRIRPEDNARPMDAPDLPSPAPLPSATPLLFGHRGSPRRALENTFASFDAAESEGADGIELDVRLTQDGEAVVYHDAELVRGDRRVALAGLTFPEALDVELRKGELTGRIHALRDVFLRFGGQLRYLVEIKPCPSPRPSLLEVRVARLLEAFALLEKAWVLSFSSDVLRRFKEICPASRTVLVFDGTAFRPEGRLWPDLPKGCDGIAPEVALVSEKLFADARASGLTTHVWTVNDPEQAARFASWGATSIVSDDPALVRDAVKGAPAAP